jgi:hypothetical protein
MGLLMAVTIEGRALRGFVWWGFWFCPFFALTAWLFIVSFGFTIVHAFFLVLTFGTGYLALESVLKKQVKITSKGVIIRYSWWKVHKIPLTSIDQLWIHRDLQFLDRGEHRSVPVPRPPVSWLRTTIQIDADKQHIVMVQDRFMGSKRKMKKVFDALALQMKLSGVEAKVFNGLEGDEPPVSFGSLLGDVLGEKRPLRAGVLSELIWGSYQENEKGVDEALVTITGRALRGALCWTSCAVPFLLLLVMFFRYPPGPLYQQFLAFLFLAGPAVPSLFLALQAARLKRVEISSTEFRFFVGQTLIYRTKLSDIFLLSLEKRYKIGDLAGPGGFIIYPPCLWRRAFLTINARQRTLEMKQDRFIGDKETLVKIFKALRHHLKKNGVKAEVADHLDWCSTSPR